MLTVFAKNKTERNKPEVEVVDLIGYNLKSQSTWSSVNKNTLVKKNRNNLKLSKAKMSLQDGVTSFQHASALLGKI